MLQAMNTGHDGSMSTGHANSPRDMLSRLETMVLMAGVDLPLRAIREQVASAVDLIVHQSRLKDGTRKITNITEVQGMEGDVIVMQDVFVFEQTGVVEGKIQGRLKRPVSARSSSRSSRSWASTCRRACSGSRTSREGGSRSMDTMTLVVAGLAAAAIIVIAMGVAMSAAARDVRAPSALRVDSKAEAASGSKGPISDLIAQSQTLANLNKGLEQRDFGANLARDLARADLRLKPSEFL